MLLHMIVLNCTQNGGVHDLVAVAKAQHDGVKMPS
jgi:hypothetical protein